MNSFIETLNQWGEHFPGFAWPMLWQSSLLIAALLVFDLLLRRKLRASIRYALWLVVLVKLCVPPTLALPTSPAWWLHRPLPPVVAKPKIQNYTVTYDQGPLPELPQTSLPVYEPPKPVMSKVAWLLVFSVSASAGLLSWMLVRWWQITRLVRRSAASDRLMALADEARRFIGMKSHVPVKLTAKAMSPAVCGLFRPVILIPQSLAAEFSDEQLRAVLLHELIHLRRCDVWLNFLQTLLQIVYWWHPLVWVANARIRRVREEAVDDAVMLALRDEAETYAPTLLEVAKLALSRPLATLGLVGILESRSALRQRIERLVDFRAPRQAGLTLVSLLGILAFTAVAVPMGEGPVPVAKSNETDAAATEEQSLTIRVNPEIFFHNLKAQAANAMLSPTNSWTEILMELLRDEGVDCNPPHGLAFTNTTGDLTTQNTREQLAVFRRVVEQLNRADGICELPLGDNPLRKSVLIEGRLYPMSDGEFGKFTTGLHRYPGGSPGEEWWSVPPETFKQFVKSVEASGLELIQRPRIQTDSGTTATFYVGDRTNGLELACKPLVGKGFIELTLESTFISGAPMNVFTNHVFSRASAEDHGGFVLCMTNYGGYAGSNLVMVISAEIVTNTVHFQERLRAVIHRNNTSNGPAVGQINGVATTDPNFRIVKHALEPRSGVESLAEPEVTTTSGRAINQMTPLTISMPVSKLGMESSDTVAMTFRVDQRVGAENLKKSLLAAGVKIPPTVFVYKNTGVFLIRGSKEQMAIANRVVLKLNGYSAAEIEAANKGFIQDISVPAMATDNSTQLFSRTFKVDARALADAMRNTPGMPTNNVSAMTRSFLSLVGLDLESPKGKAVFYNDTLGKLFVKATAADLDTIERVIAVLGSVAPQIHIKARFVEVPKGTMSAFGQFPGPTNSPNGGFTGILSSTNARVVLRALESREGFETLAEPEVVTTSGRQTQMRATQTLTNIMRLQQTWVTNHGNVTVNESTIPQTTPIEIGPILDVVPYVLSDGYTINLTLIPSVTKILVSSNSVPRMLPEFSVRRVVTTLNLWDNQTAVIGGFPETDYFGGKKVTDKSKTSDKELLVFVTATIIDPAGNRVHPDDSSDGIPPQPPQPK